MTFAQIIITPITTEAGAMAFLQALVDADKTYHLEDGPHTIINFETDLPVFTRKEADAIEARVAECYALPCWTSNDCPIGRMMRLYVSRPLTETTTDALSERYTEWLQWNHLADRVQDDAWAVIMLDDITTQQREWISEFIRYWERVQDAEDAINFKKA